MIIIISITDYRQSSFEYACSIDYPFSKCVIISFTVGASDTVFLLLALLFVYATFFFIPAQIKRLASLF